MAPQNTFEIRLLSDLELVTKNNAGTDSGVYIEGSCYPAQVSPKDPKFLTPELCKLIGRANIYQFVPILVEHGRDVKGLGDRPIGTVLDVSYLERIRKLWFKGFINRGTNITAETVKGYGISIAYEITLGPDKKPHSVKALEVSLVKNPRFRDSKIVVANSEDDTGMSQSAQTSAPPAESQSAAQTQEVAVPSDAQTAPENTATDNAPKYTVLGEEALKCVLSEGFNPKEVYDSMTNEGDRIALIGSLTATLQQTMNQKTVLEQGEFVRSKEQLLRDASGYSLDKSYFDAVKDAKSLGEVTALRGTLSYMQPIKTAEPEQAATQTGNAKAAPRKTSANAGDMFTQLMTRGGTNTSSWQSQLGKHTRPLVSVNSADEPNPKVARQASLPTSQQDAAFTNRLVDILKNAAAGVVV